MIADMNDSHNNSQALSVAASIEQALTSSTVSVRYDENAGAYTLVGATELLASVERTSASFESLLFDENDRKSPATARAQVNKIIKALKEQVSAEQKRLFGPVETDVRALQSSLNKLSALLKERVDYADKVFQSQRIERLEAEFERVKAHRPELETLTFAQILNPSWLNRSVSEAKALDSLYERLESAKQLASLTGSAAETIELLVSHKWSLSRAMGAWQEANRPAEPELDVDEKELGEAELEVSVTLPASDIDVLKRLASNRQWKLSVRSVNATL